MKIASTLAKAILLCVTTIAHAAAVPTRVVYPTGSHPQDVQNVQAALDGGGTVLLKATNPAGVPTHFSMGPSGTAGGFVEFHVDAQLIGERLPGAETTLRGGWYPVRGFGDAATVAVRDIAFASSFDGSLLLQGAANTEVTGNRMSNVIGRFRTPRRTTAEVIVVGFAGQVLVENNIIEGTVANSAIGVSQFRSAGPVAIRRNTISDTGYGTIESSFNVDSATGKPALVSITDNSLRPGPAPRGFGVGIEINGEGNYYVARNDIFIESPQGLGIYALGAPGFGIAPMIAPVIEKNRVTVKPGGSADSIFADGIDLIGAVSGAYVGENAIEGESFAALGLYDVGDEADDLGFNTYVGNQIARFRPLVADVFLDTAAHDTVFKGYSGLVIDLGANNHLTGAGPNGHAQTGERVREATRRRHEAMQSAGDLFRSDGPMK